MDRARRGHDVPGPLARALRARAPPRARSGRLMGATLSTLLGITFVVCAIVAVLLQAWLWDPKYWNAETKKSHAPPFWIGVHRFVGWLYASIYVAMMFEMLPRLWEFQEAMPALGLV